MPSSPQFWRGRIGVAFVFSAPGAEELDGGSPSLGIRARTLSRRCLISAPPSQPCFPLRIGTTTGSRMPGHNRSPLRSVTAHRGRATHRSEAQTMSGAFFMNSRAATSLS